MAAWGDGAIVSLLLAGFKLERASRNNDESGKVGGERYAVGRLACLPRNGEVSMPTDNAGTRHTKNGLWC